MKPVMKISLWELPMLGIMIMRRQLRIRLVMVSVTQSLNTRTLKQNTIKIQTALM